MLKDAKACVAVIGSGQRHWLWYAVIMIRSRDPSRCHRARRPAGTSRSGLPRWSFLLVWLWGILIHGRHSNRSWNPAKRGCKSATLQHHLVWWLSWSWHTLAGTFSPCSIWAKLNMECRCKAPLTYFKPAALKPWTEGTTLSKWSIKCRTTLSGLLSFCGHWLATALDFPRGRIARSTSAAWSFSLDDKRKEVLCLILPPDLSRKVLSHSDLFAVNADNKCQQRDFVSIPTCWKVQKVPSQQNQRQHWTDNTDKLGATIHTIVSSFNEHAHMI